MPKPLLIFIFTFAALFCCNINIATAGPIPVNLKQNSPVKKVTLKLRTDSSEVKVNHFNEQALKNYRNNKEYRYTDTNNYEEETSYWDRFWNWVWRKLFGSINLGPTAGPIIKYIFLAIAIGLLLFFIFKLIGMDAIGLWRGESRKTKLAYDESLENIHHIDFDAEIEKAISKHNYRAAVRLLYLKCLKQLSDENLIQWQIDKTNWAYAYELNNPSVRQAFLLLTRQFEYVWYGGFSIDGNAFNNINQLFQNFKKQLL